MQYGYSKTLSTWLIATGITLASATAHADYFVETPNCPAPKKPLEFVTELDKQEFDKKVDAYRDCLETFVDKHNTAMGKHKQSADKAVSEWQRYTTQVLGMEPKPADAPTAPVPAPQGALESTPGSDAP